MTLHVLDGDPAYPAFPLEHWSTTADAPHEEKHLRLYMPNTPYAHHGGKLLVLTSGKHLQCCYDA